MKSHAAVAYGFEFATGLAFTGTTIKGTVIGFEALTHSGSPYDGYASGQAEAKMPLGILGKSATSGEKFLELVIPGTVCQVLSSSAGALSGGTVGAAVYCEHNATAGKIGTATMTPPSSSGNTIIRLGYLVDPTNDLILFNPEYIATIP